MSTEAKRRANARYLGTQDDIKVRVKKGDKEKYKAHAEQKGMSLNALIVQLLEKDIEIENS